jgi:cobyrinic acid a,c-diamide synthase
VQPFKKGPDFIDPAWLTRAAGTAARNLDVRLCGVDAVLELFARHAPPHGVAIIEGNRGLFDGGDARGTHSTASLARTLGAPVVLVVNAAKVTRTLAAVVLGCKLLEPETPLVGVILNRVAGARHGRVATEAVEHDTGLPVLGVLPKLAEDPIPARHLGLLTPDEHAACATALQRVERLIAEHVDLERVLAIARAAVPIARHEPLWEPASSADPVRVGVLQDSAFTFYYPDNLEALERAGARLVPISPLADQRLPVLDALYVGGGFPETHAQRLSHNAALREAIRGEAAAGLPVYAECGGLMYVSRALHMGERVFEMAGLLPVDTAMEPRPMGHGYVRLRVDSPNPFYPVGLELDGHEFHYSRVVPSTAGVELVFAVQRGTGVGTTGREGICRGNVLATYVHVHALGVPEWATGIVAAARRRIELRATRCNPELS